MKSKIAFHDLKMEIAEGTKVVSRFYGELMYIIYDAPYCRLYFNDTQKYQVKIALQFMSDNLPISFVLVAQHLKGNKKIIQFAYQYAFFIGIFCIFVAYRYLMLCKAKKN